MSQYLLKGLRFSLYSSIFSPGRFSYAKKCFLDEKHFFSSRKIFFLATRKFFLLLEKSSCAKKKILAFRHFIEKTFSCLQKILL